MGPMEQRCGCSERALWEQGHHVGLSALLAPLMRWASSSCDAESDAETRFFPKSSSTPDKLNKIGL
jgi:hypothetical protein